jgi:hypothetical protein
MKLKILLLTILTAYVLPGFAQAEGLSESGQQDRQGKGISQQKERGERFANTDTNGDQQLSREEVENTAAKRLVEHFDKIDKNGDGQLTKDELKAAHKKRAKRAPKGKQCSNCKNDTI